MAVVAGMKKPNDHAEPTKVELFYLLYKVHVYSIIITKETCLETIIVTHSKCIHCSQLNSWSLTSSAQKQLNIISVVNYDVL